MARNESALDAIFDEVLRERDEQLRHFESLDSKAGLMLGFAGVLVALGGAGNSIAVAGKLYAVAAAGWSVGALLSRRYASIDLRQLRRRYWNEDTTLVKGFLLDTHIRTASIGHRLLRDKAVQLQIAAAHGMVATVLVCWSILRP